MKRRLQKKREKRSLRGRPAAPLPRVGRNLTPPGRLADLIRCARLNLGRKAFAVADEAGLSASRYYEIEGADFVNPPPLPVLLRIAGLLKIENDAIISRFTECAKNAS